MRARTPFRLIRPTLTAGALVAAASLLVAGAPDTVRVRPLEQADYTKLEVRKLKLQDFVPQVGHSRHLTSLHFSADGKTLASASGLDDGSVKLWDVATGRVLRTLDGEDFAAVSPDGATVVTGNVGGPIEVWDVATGAKLKTLKGSGPVAFTRDGKTLIGEADAEDVGDAGWLQGWSVDKDYAKARQYEGHDTSIIAISMDAGGEFFATASYDGSVKIWNQATGDVARTFTRESGDIPNAVALSSDAETLAVSYQGDPDIEVWDVSASKVVHTLKGHSKLVTSLAFAGAKTLASGSADGTTRMWDASTGKQTRVMEDSGGVVAFSADDATLAHGRRGITLSGVADGATQRVLAANDAQILSAVFTRDNKQLITTDALTALDIWDVKSGRLVSTRDMDNGTRDDPKGELVLSPFRTYVAKRPFVGNTMQIVSSKDGSLVKEFTLEGASSLRGVTFSMSEKEFVVESSQDGDDSTQLSWWSLESDEPLSRTKMAGFVEVKGFVDEDASVALVSMGSARSGARLSIKLWGRDTGLMQSVRVKGIAPYSGDIDFSAKGGQIALADVDSSVKVWDRTAGKVTHTKSAHTDLVNHIAFSPDGKVMATASWDKTVRVWLIGDEAPVMNLDDSHYNAQHLTFSPDDHTLAISHSGWLRLIHLPTGRSRMLFRKADGWMGYDSAGNFDCAKTGCDLAMWRTQEGDYVGASTKQLKKLKGLKTFR